MVRRKGETSFDVKGKQEKGAPSAATKERVRKRAVGQNRPHPLLTPPAPPAFVRSTDSPPEGGKGGSPLAFGSSFVWTEDGSPEALTRALADLRRAFAEAERQLLAALAREPR